MSIIDRINAAIVKKTGGQVPTIELSATGFAVLAQDGRLEFERQDLNAAYATLATGGFAGDRIVLILGFGQDDAERTITLAEDYPGWQALLDKLDSENWLQRPSASWLLEVLVAKDPVDLYKPEP